MALYQRNLTSPYFGQDLGDEHYLKEYYEVGRQYYRAINDLPRAYAFSDSLTRLVDRIHKRLLALSKLQLDTRQMSRILGIAPESIRKTKYRPARNWELVVLPPF